MDTLTIVIGTVAVAVLMGLAWIGGYEIGTASGANAEREIGNRRVNGAIDSMKELIAKENKRKPRKRRTAK